MTSLQITALLAVIATVAASGLYDYGYYFPSYQRNYAPLGYGGKYASAYDKGYDKGSSSAVGNYKYGEQGNYEKGNEYGSSYGHDSAKHVNPSYYGYAQPSYNEFYAADAPIGYNPYKRFDKY